jgi:phospholipid/cholesterol/gamma-HCH transport system substrate-binding protein
MHQGAVAVNSTLSDSAFINNLNKSMQHINNSTLKLEENLEALKHSFLFRRYFRRQEKKKGEKVLNLN